MKFMLTSAFDGKQSSLNKEMLIFEKLMEDAYKKSVSFVSF